MDHAKNQSVNQSYKIFFVFTKMLIIQLKIKMNLKKRNSIVALSEVIVLWYSLLHYLHTFICA